MDGFISIYVLVPIYGVEMALSVRLLQLSISMYTHCRKLQKHLNFENSKNLQNAYTKNGNYYTTEHSTYMNIIKIS